jgi:hypothetical protein
MDLYSTPGTPPREIRRWSRWIDANDRTTRYLVAEQSPTGAELVPVRVVSDRTHPAAGSVFYVRRSDFRRPAQAGDRMSAQPAFDHEEKRRKTVTELGLSKERRPGPEQLLAALVRRGLAEEDLPAAAMIALILDEDAGR